MSLQVPYRGPEAYLLLVSQDGTLRYISLQTMDEVWSTKLRGVGSLVSSAPYIRENKKKQDGSLRTPAYQGNSSCTSAPSEKHISANSTKKWCPLCKIHGPSRRCSVPYTRSVHRDEKAFGIGQTPSLVEHDADTGTSVSKADYLSVRHCGQTCSSVPECGVLAPENWLAVFTLSDPDVGQHGFPTCDSPLTLEAHTPLSITVDNPVQKDDATTVQWYYRHTVEAPWMKMGDTVNLWNKLACRDHRLVQLCSSEDTYMELDLLSGNSLAFMGEEMDSPVESYSAGTGQQLSPWREAERSSPSTAESPDGAVRGEGRRDSIITSTSTEEPRAILSITACTHTVRLVPRGATQRWASKSKGLAEDCYGVKLVSTTLSLQVGYNYLDVENGVQGGTSCRTENSSSDSSSGKDIELDVLRGRKLINASSSSRSMASAEDTEGNGEESWHQWYCIHCEVNGIVRVMRTRYEKEATLHSFPHSPLVSAYVVDMGVANNHDIVLARRSPALYRLPVRPPLEEEKLSTVSVLRSGAMLGVPSTVYQNRHRIGSTPGTRDDALTVLQLRGMMTLPGVTVANHVLLRGIVRMDECEESVLKRGTDSLCLPKDGTVANVYTHFRSTPSATSGAACVAADSASHLWNMQLSADALVSSNLNSSSSAATSFFDENFEPLMVLGRGMSGVVLLVCHRVTGIFYAVKVLLARSWDSEQEVLREVRVHALLHNRFVVRYHACWTETVTPLRAQQLAFIGLCSSNEGVGVPPSLRLAGGQLNSACGVAGAGNWGNINTGSLNNGLYLVGDESLSTTHSSSLLSTGKQPTLQSDGDWHFGRSHDGDNHSSAASSDSTNSEEQSIVGSHVVFLQMQYYQLTLAQQLATRRSIDRMENLIIALQLLAGLRYLHKQDILHRDVKPTNVFMDYRCQHSIEEPHESSASETDSIEDDSPYYMNLGTNGKPPDEAGPSDAFALWTRHSVESVSNTVLSAPDGSEKLLDIITQAPHRSAEELLKDRTQRLLQTIRTGSNYRSKPDGGVWAIDVGRQLRRDPSEPLASHSSQCGSTIEQKPHTVRSMDDVELGEAVWRRDETRRACRWLQERLVQVRLGDFGLAKFVQQQHLEVNGYFSRSDINTVGVGSPLYSSPEQLKGNLCTAASDAFSAGILLAEMYMQPTTVAERLVILREAREGRFPTPSLLQQYPELRVVAELTRENPGHRMSLNKARIILTGHLRSCVHHNLFGCRSSQSA